MEYYNNTLCLEVNWLINERIMSYDYYKKLNQRNQIDVVRRACLNTPALVAYDSIPDRFRKLIVVKIGDPHKIVHKSKLLATITPDPKALTFYRDEFRLENGDQLPADVQTEYRTNAEILNAIHAIVSERKPNNKKLGGDTKGIWVEMAKAVSMLDKTVFKHSLPSNDRRLQDKYIMYMADGYHSLIHGNFCNKNSERINDKAKHWLIARWISKVNPVASEMQLLHEYNAMADTMEWKKLKSDATIHNYLFQPEVQSIWFAHRYGELKAKERLVYQHKTILPTMRDSIWYSDGTKLNYYYQYRTPEGVFKMGTKMVYEVMDAYSECLLGYHISDTEDSTDQFEAYRMALQFSGHKPYQLTYDNQGGHKKLASGQFLTKLSHLAIATRPYNGKSKTIENVFKRFQENYLKKDWFFTGMNITTVTLESRADMEYIMANKHGLPTLAEMMVVYKMRREEWNNAPHPKTGRPRIEMYRESHNPKAAKLEMMDMVDLFWILRDKPVMSTAYGIHFQEKKEHHDFVVNGSDGLPDFAWIARNRDRKFRIKYDPTDYSMIYLYEDTAQGLRFVTAADRKIEIHRGKQEQEEWEAEWMKKVEKADAEFRLSNNQIGLDIMEMFNELPEQHGFVTPSVKGINSKKKPGKKQRDDNFGRLQKAVSNAVFADDDMITEKELYAMY